MPQESTLIVEFGVTPQQSEKYAELLVNIWLVANAKLRGTMWMWYHQGSAFLHSECLMAQLLANGISSLVQQSGYRLNFLGEVFKKNAKSAFFLSSMNSSLLK